MLPTVSTFCFCGFQATIFRATDFQAVVTVEAALLLVSQAQFKSAHFF